MSKTNSKSFSSIVIESLGWPLFWGLAATFGFYLLLGWGIIQNNLVSRYFAGHPVEYIETALFFIGVAALLMKAFDLAFQFSAVPETKLPTAAASGDSPERTGELLASLKKLPERLRETYLAQRLFNALRYVHQSESAEGIDDQLRYLSDVDAERSHDGYSLVRMIIWATPMLGFLGTVIGITLALGNLSPEALVDAPKDAMQGLLAGLSVAFDTTALALSLSIVLMFIQFLVREVETQLLTAVDRKAEDELVGRFVGSSQSGDPQVAAMKRISQHVVESVEKLSQRQAASLESTVTASQKQWSTALQATSTAVQANLQHAVGRWAENQSEAFVKAEHVASQRIADRWGDIQRGMQEQASILSAQHEAISRQSEIMERVVTATGDVKNLESALNQNLSALAGAKNFQDTVMSLSAAIQLLTSRLGVTTRDVQLHNDQERAA